MKTKDEILERMALYRVAGGGIGSWLTADTCGAVFERLGRLDNEPLSAVQLNQLLVLAHEAPVSDGFFRYYWCDTQSAHPYDVRALPGFKGGWQQATQIQSLDHLAWGLHRLYTDGLLYFGNVRTAFRNLREHSHSELQEYFSGKCFDTQAIKRRGPSLPLRTIDKDKRYLISEMACKSYGDNPRIKSDLLSALTAGFESFKAANAGESVTIARLLDEFIPTELKSSQGSLQFSASEICSEQVGSQADVIERYQRIADRFDEARRDALKNTDYYLSMLTDLDVYVATSMRTPEHFLKMAELCDTVFSDQRLREMNLRYFDPTLSAANGHEDKGLIECLMVKCAKALVYCGGDKESYGKDAEAAMALSLGKPVVFFCEQRSSFYREVHPLTRLIQFETGVAVGAMVTDQVTHVAELLARTFENRMEYCLDRSKSGSLRLIEALTGSVVRLQTSDKLLTETFWNHYHQDRSKRRQSPVVIAAADAPRRRPAEVTVLRPQEQAKLALEDTNSAMPLAARALLPAADPQPAVPPTRPKSATDESFPLSPREIFDGIAKLKSTETVRAKRFGVFEEWLRSERVNILEGIRLLRFVEATLESKGVRPNFVYKQSELSGWYAEMSDGKVVGS